MQFMKVLVPSMFFKVEGKVTDVRLVQWSKTLPSMWVSPSGMTTEVRESQLAKTAASIDFRFFGNIMDFRVFDSIKRKLQKVSSFNSAFNFEGAL